MILSALPLSFDAGFSQLTTAFTVGAHVVLLNYLLPRDVVRLCRKHRVTGLTGVPPLWIQLAESGLAAEAHAQLRYFANTGGRMPRATLAGLRAICPAGQALPDVRADRGVPLDLPRPGRGRPPARLHRQGHPERRDPRRAPRRHAVRARRGGRARAPRRAGGDGLLERPGADRRALPPRPGRAWTGLPTQRDRGLVGRHRQADEEGFLYFVGRSDEMIKTSGYRVSPTEIEEVAYGTGLVRDAVALGVDDPRPGPARSCSSSVPADGTARSSTRCSRDCRQQLPLYMVPSDVVVACRAAAIAERQVRPQRCCGEELARMTDARCHHGRTRRASESGRLRVGGVPLDRARRAGRGDAVLRLRPRAADRAGRRCCGPPCPPGIDLSYAIKANPMPAVVQHLSGLVDGFDVASAAEMRAALDTPMPAEPGQLRRSRQDGGELAQAVAAGVTIEVESATEAERRRR